MENMLFLWQEFLQNKITHCPLQKDDDVPYEKVGKAKNETLQQDHAVHREKYEKVMDGEDVKNIFQVSRNEKFFHLQDVDGNEEDWKSEREHLEGLLASRAKSVTRVDWKNLALLDLSRLPVGKG